jgi:2-amino-4-hydroxy-6-hydroxymethyldihydropteridine diphosphokinase
MIMEKIYLGLGTNLDDRELNLRKAINNVDELIGSVVHVSSIYETEPVGF